MRVKAFVVQVAAAASTVFSLPMATYTSERAMIAVTYWNDVMNKYLAGALGLHWLFSMRCA